MWYSALGDWIVRYGIWLSSAALLALIGATHLGLHLWIRHRTEATNTAEVPQTRQERLWSSAIRQLTAPLALLLWITGMRAVLLLLVAGLVSSSRSGPFLSAVGWVYALTSIAALWWLLRRVAAVVSLALSRLAARSQGTLDDAVMPEVARSLGRLLPLLALVIGGPLLSATSPAIASVVGHLASLIVIGAIAFIALQAVNIAAEAVLHRHRLDVANNLHARAIHTQVAGLKKIATAIVMLFTIASMLMVFEPVRQIGASILASAGVAGIVLGFAAQKGLATLLAGIQVTLTQPIRVDDVVVVEEEFGNVEEITLTYVVIRLWDLRRLVVPISLFIEKPFENWTRSSSDLIGAVTFPIPRDVPLSDLRAELTRVLQNSPLWDGKVNVLQVTELHDQTMDVRALVSAANAAQQWDLRCEVREQLGAFLVRRGSPHSSPPAQTPPQLGGAGAIVTEPAGTGFPVQERH